MHVEGNQTYVAAMYNMAKVRNHFFHLLTIFFLHPGIFIFQKYKNSNKVCKMRC